MSLIKCTQCGELFSDSYRECPFCAEDEEYYRGNVKKGSRHRSAAKKRSAFAPLLTLVLVVLIGGGVWFFFGSNIQDFLHGDKVNTPIADIETKGEDQQEETVAVALVMDKTLRIAPNDSKTISVSGGTSYQWVSSDPTVASVNSSGVVTGVNEGTAIITATDSSGQSAVCSVTVTENGSEPENGGTTGSGTTTNKPTKPVDGGSSTSTKVDVSKLKFSIPIYGVTLSPMADGSYDVTMEKSLGENSLEIEIDGTTSSIGWSSGNEGVVTASGGKTDSGKLTATFKAVSTGSATVTAKIGDSSVKFLVRVK